MIDIKAKIKLEKIIFTMNDSDLENLLELFQIIINLNDYVGKYREQIPELNGLEEFSQFVFATREKLLPYHKLDIVGLTEKNRIE